MEYFEVFGIAREVLYKYLHSKRVSGFGTQAGRAHCAVILMKIPLLSSKTFFSTFSERLGAGFDAEAKTVMRRYHHHHNHQAGVWLIIDYHKPNCQPETLGSSMLLSSKVPMTTTQIPTKHQL